VASYQRPSVHPSGFYTEKRTSPLLIVGLTSRLLRGKNSEMKATCMASENQSHPNQSGEIQGSSENR
jgi:hypothetical protein